MGAQLAQVQEALRGGDVVPESVQEELGLVGVTSADGYASGVLLSRDWVLTAAHAVGPLNPDETPVKDPAYPTGYRTYPAQTMKVTAAWGGGQTRGVSDMTPMWQTDAALLKLDAPLECSSLPPGTRRPIVTEDAPFFLLQGARYLTLFGRGAYNAEHDIDGQWRTGYAYISEEEEHRFFFSSLTGDKMSAGDSGGPVFTGTPGGLALVGLMAGYDPRKGAYGALLRSVLRRINEKVAAGSAAPSKVFPGVFPTGGPSEDQDAIGEFRTAAAWATSRDPKGGLRYETGIPTMQHTVDGLRHYTSRIGILEGFMEWRWVLQSELSLTDLNDFRATMRAVDGYAVANGFAGALPAFTGVDFSDGYRVGLWLAGDYLAERRAVPLADLDLTPMPTFGKRREHPIKDLFLAGATYAAHKAGGFDGGWPTMAVGPRLIPGQFGEKAQVVESADVVMLRTGIGSMYQPKVFLFEDPH